MMLCKLAFQNIRKSMKDYAVYFFTLILGVAVFYIFNALGQQTVMLPIQESTRDVLRLMMNVLKVVSVFVAIVLGCLILYANQFLMKRRKREFGLYMMLGMGKWKISGILLLETVGIGLLSLIIGLGIGVIGSQLTSALTANMFEADMDKFTFVYSAKTMWKTVLYFALMYIPAILLNAFIIGKCKLIDLFQASRRNEEIRMKSPTVCVFIFAAAAVMLGQAYWQVTDGAASVATFFDVIFVMFRGALGTYLVFWSLSGLLLKLVMQQKKVYFHNLNSFTFRQIHSRIHTMVAAMTIICLMLFMSICVLSCGIYMNKEATAELDKMIPADLQVTKTRNLENNAAQWDLDVTPAQIENSHTSISESLEQLGFSGKLLLDVQELDLYRDGALSGEQTLGSALEEMRQSYPDLSMESPVFVRISDYNRLAELTGQKSYTLKENEYMVIADFERMAVIRNMGLEAGAEIPLLGKTYIPKYQVCKDGYIFMNSSHVNGGIFLVPDTAVDDSLLYKSVLTSNYNAGSKNEKMEIEKKIAALAEEPEYSNFRMEFLTRISSSEASMGVGAMATFIGLYLGVVFLITSAAILALKELSESADNRERYLVLRKLGADEKMVRKSLFRQIGIFFLMPLVLAVIHSVFGIQVVQMMFDLSGQKWLTSSVISTAGIIILIYGGYFLITYFCSRTIVKDTGERGW